MSKIIQQFLYFIVPVFLFVIVWWIISAIFHNTQLLPDPIIVGKTFITSLKDDLLNDAIASIQRVLFGFLIASVLGVFLGLLCGVNKWISRLISPILELLRPIPPIAWIPLAILWFGIGNNPAYFLVFLGAFFPIFSNTYLGVSSVEETYKRAAYSLGATRKEIITDIILPASMPQIFTGLKIGLGVGWMVVIAAELVGAQSGLGYMIQLNRFLLNSPEIITGMLTIGFVGFLLNLLITKIEKLSVPWSQKM
jgi:ABC-type nitrate/sulfonate/bicarbonate transport system permease component